MDGIISKTLQELGYNNITNNSDTNTSKKIQDLENKINSLIKEIEKIKKNI